MSIQRLQIGPRMSQAVVHGGLVYLAGQVADDPSQDVAGQTRQVLAAIDALLAQAGTDKTRILRAEIFGSSGSRVGDFGVFQGLGSMQVRIFRRRYSSSRRP